MNNTPQKENGYTPIANEIIEAMSQTNFNSYQIRLLFAVLRKTYGYGKKEDWISNSQLCNLTGLRKQHISRAKAELVKRNVIVTSSGNKIRFNKDYSQWIELPRQVTTKKVTSSGSGVTSSGEHKRNFTKERETKKKTKEKKESKNSIQLILDFFNSTCKTELRLTPKKIQQITSRRKVYSDDEIKRAIVARLKSPFHCGENSEGKVWYRDWDSLFRNDERIEHALSAEFIRPKLKGRELSL
jgi:phage replication O-like protein O